MNKKYTFCIPILLLFLVLVSSTSSCTRPAVGKTDAKEELIRSLKGANVDGFHFATTEDAAQETASLTNSAVENLITFDDKTSSVVLRYASIRDKNKNATRIYKTEVAKSGTTLELLITDVATSEVILKKAFPPIQPIPNQPTYDSFEACFDNFDCTRRPALQCEANRTCEPQFEGIICCQRDGQCLSVHFIIKPNSPRCRLRDLIPDVKGFSLSR